LIWTIGSAAIQVPVILHWYDGSGSVARLALLFTVPSVIGEALTSIFSNSVMRSPSLEGTAGAHALYDGHPSAKIPERERERSVPENIPMMIVRIGEVIRYLFREFYI
jgi:hypothetical protein